MRKGRQDDPAFDKTDTGAYTIPASVFSGPGTYDIGVERSEQITVAGVFVGFTEVATVDTVTF